MGHWILPVEIWGIIFKLATACPEEWEFGTRERYWNHSFDPNSMIGRWGDALKTRRSLVAVSRFFNQLTIPLLYQGFFAVGSRQVSRFRSALQTRPALGEYIKRLSLSAQLKKHIITDYPLILRFCPNVVFYDAALRRSGLKPAPSLHALELIYSPEFNNVLTEPEFPQLLASILQATPQLEHLGLYQLPYRIKATNRQPFVSTKLEYLRSLHLRADSIRIFHPPGTTLTIPLFFSLTLPRLEDLLLEGGESDEAVLNGIPALWVQQIRQFNIPHGSIMSSRLQPNHFHRLRKLTLDFSFTYAPRAELHEKLPLIQLGEIALVDCITSIDLRSDMDFKVLYLVFCLCADDTTTPKLRSLSTDIMELEKRHWSVSPQMIKGRLKELQSVVKRILARGIEPKGLDSSSLRSIIQKLIETTETWLIDDGLMTRWVSSCSEDEEESWGSGD